MERSSADNYRVRTVVAPVVSGQTQGMSRRRTTLTERGPGLRYSDEPVAEAGEDIAEPPESSTGLAVHRVGGWRQLANAAPEKVNAWRLKPRSK